MIHFEGVSKFYDNLTALRNVTFSVGKGEMVFVSGPSGAGKTTLLRLIFLAEKPDGGTLTVNNIQTHKMKESEIPLLRRKIGVVFQDFRLLSRTVFENVALAMRIRGIRESAVKPLVFDALKMVNLRHKADNMPYALSGGEQQRVAIARAIVGEPTVLLADEPTGNLDPDTAAGIMRIFREVNTKGTTILHATHNRSLFRGTGNRVFRLERGEVSLEAGV